MTPEALLEALRASAESKGYYLHADAAQCRDTAESLLENEERYGYLCCPCRLASGDVKKDADMVCPCEYRDADIREYGACYCLLFVSAQHKDNPKFFPEIDDRREPED